MNDRDVLTPETLLELGKELAEKLSRGHEDISFLEREGFSTERLLRLSSVAFGFYQLSPDVHERAMLERWSFERIEAEVS